MNRLNHLLVAALLPATISLAAGATQAEEDIFQIEEVVVTAQKRAQSVQDVGISLTAIGGEELKNLGVQNLADVTNIVSGVELYDDTGGGQPTWVIRGVGLSDFNPNNTPTAAVYVDEVYMGYNAMGGAAMFDIERIEVLKGPQGGLYGRNTSGGAVKVISNRPSSENSGYVSANYGRWNEVKVEGAANFALSDDVLGRVSGFWTDGGAWQESIGDNKDHGDKDKWALRAQLLFTPSDSTEIYVKAYAGEDKSDINLGRSMAVYSLTNPSGVCSGVLDGSGNTGSSDCVNFLGQTEAGQSSNGDKVYTQAINQLDNSFQGLNITAKFELDRFTLTSVTGIDSFDYKQVNDFDGTGAILLTYFYDTAIDAWSQEFRLSGSDDNFQWQAGIMIAHDELVEDRSGDIKDLLEATQLTPIALQYKQETDTWGVFAQGEYDLSDDWVLNVALRYTDEDKTYRDGMSDLTNLDLPLLANYESDFELEKHFSGKIGLEWSPTEDILAYASFSRGFKSGGFQGGFVLFDPSVEVAPYKEEIVHAYEIGLKSQLLDKTLQVNSAIFYYDYQDAQGYLDMPTNNVPGLSTLEALGNVGDAVHKGAELDVTWLPAQGLTLAMAVTYLDAHIVDSDMIGADAIGFGSFPVENGRRGSSPRWSANTSVNYEAPVAEGLVGTMSVSYSWRDDQATGVTGNHVNRALTTMEAYGLLTARFALASEADTWSIGLWGKNLTDEEYDINKTTDFMGSFMSIPGHPMSYGVDVTYNW